MDYLCFYSGLSDLGIELAMAASKFEQVVQVDRLNVDLEVSVSMHSFQAEGTLINVQTWDVVDAIIFLVFISGSAFWRCRSLFTPLSGQELSKFVQAPTENR